MIKFVFAICLALGTLFIGAKADDNPVDLISIYEESSETYEDLDSDKDWAEIEVAVEQEQS